MSIDFEVTNISLVILVGKILSWITIWEINSKLHKNINDSKGEIFNDKL